MDFPRTIAIIPSVTTHRPIIIRNVPSLLSGFPLAPRIPIIATIVGITTALINSRLALPSTSKKRKKSDAHIAVKIGIT